MWDPSRFSPKRVAMSSSARLLANAFRRMISGRTDSRNDARTG
jgi:hypothetical protein